MLIRKIMIVRYNEMTSLWYKQNVWKNLKNKIKNNFSKLLL